MPCRTGRRTCRRSRSASSLSLSTPCGGIRGQFDLPAFDSGQSLLEREPFRHLPHDLTRPVQVAFELREPDDLRRETALPALFQNPSLIVDLVDAEGASPAMIMRAVVSSVCPRRSSRIGSAAFRSGTWPGERNSSANAWAAHPFSRFTASFAMAASRAIVLARSTSVTPVNVSRWFTAIENALCRSYLKSSAETASRTG